MTIKGLIFPTALPFVSGSGTPRDSAIAAQNNMNLTQNKLNQTVGGKKTSKTSKKRKTYKKNKSSKTSKKRKTKYLRKKIIKRKIGGSNITVPQFQMQYKDVSGPGGSPNDQIKTMSSVNMQSASWSKYDNLAKKI